MPSNEDLASSSIRLSTLARSFSVPRGFGDATLRSSNPDRIELMGGVPHADALPVEEYRSAVERVWDSRQAAVAGFQYSASGGLAPLREWIADREKVDPSRILITNGGFHGLSLAVQVLVERGGLVAVDNPIFPLFLRSLELSSATTLPIPVDRDGLDVDYLRARLEEGSRPVAVYTVPDFHNPSQGTLVDARRLELIRLAQQYNFVVIADNPYRELRFAGHDEDFSIFNNSDRVVHVNTFTKTLGPGLRLGWLVLPSELVGPFTQLRNRQDSQTSTVQQTIIIELLTENPIWFDDKLVRARELYRSRAHTLEAALHAELPGVFETTSPEGGFFLWARLADDAIDAARLHELALAQGVDYQQGAYFASGPGTDSDRRLRLAYSNRSEAQLHEAARRLRLAYEQLGVSATR